MKFLHKIFGLKPMSDFLLIIGFLVVWMTLQYVILPKLGVGT